MDYKKTKADILHFFSKENLLIWTILKIVIYISEDFK